MIKKEIYFKNDEHYSSQIEFLGDLQLALDLDLISFKFEDHLIRNPLVDETDRMSVLPSEYYGKAFIESDFLDKYKVKAAISKIESKIDLLLMRYAKNNKMDFYYDLLANTFVMKNKSKRIAFEGKVNLLIGCDLVEDLKEVIK
jgi:hypothetical protein